MLHIRLFTRWSLIFALIAFGACSSAVAQKPGLILDGNNDVAFIGKNGHRTILAEHDHCMELMGTPKNRILACAVSQGVGDHGYRPARQIEIYTSSGRKLIIEPGGPIRDWRLWHKDRQVSVSFDRSSGHLSHALYDIQTGKLLREIEDPANPSTLPEWAKSRTQLRKESVPMDQHSQEIRYRWVENIVAQIGTIKPGMHRRELDALFRMDGGLEFNARTDRYDLRECPAIKIDVHFASGSKTNQGFHIDPDDTIESVSKPYLELPFAD